MKNACFFLLLLAVASCGKLYIQPQEPIPSNEQIRGYLHGYGQIKAYACSRSGRCAQYVLLVEKDRYFPLNLAEEFKKGGLEVSFEGKLQAGKTMIKGLGPNDGWIPYFEARNIYILSMD